VVKYWPANRYRTPGYTDALQDIGVEVIYGPHHGALSDWLKVNGTELDLVLLSRPDVAALCLPALRSFTTARIAYYGHDLHFRRMAADAALGGDPNLLRAAGAMQDLEVSIWHDVDLALYPSDEEADMVRTLAPAVQVCAVTPYAFAEAAPEQNGPEPSADGWILFVAGFAHSPNETAALWFVHEVLPSVLARVPHARLAIVGSNPGARVVQLCSSPGVNLFANVTDAALLAWYRRATVAVVPLLTGAGVKLKTVEALWHGVPVVSTPAGAQGLPGLDAIVAVETAPAAFAAAVCALLTDSALRQQRSAAQIRHARERFSEPAQMQSLLAALQRIGLQRTRLPSAQTAKGCLVNLAMA